MGGEVWCLDKKNKKAWLIAPILSKFRGFTYTTVMKYEAEKGDSIYIAAQKAIILAQKHNSGIVLVFNEINISVSQFSYDIDISEIYNLKCEIRRLKRWTFVFTIGQLKWLRPLCQMI